MPIGKDVATRESGRRRAVRKTCPKCGKEKNEWAQPGGFREEGETFCCKGCYQDTGCTCTQQAYLRARSGWGGRKGARVRH